MEYCALRVLLAFFCPTFIGALTTTLVLVDPDQPVCSGEMVTYMCTVGGNIITWHVPGGQFSLVNGRNEGVERSFHWKVLEQPMDSTIVQSTLTFSAVEGYSIGCRNPSEELVSSLEVQVEGPPSAPDQPLTSIASIHRINSTLSTVTVIWTRPEENSDRISRYVITVDPPTLLPANGTVELADPLFMDREVTVALRHEQRYTFKVRADNCNNMQQGPFSTPLSIFLQVPPPARSCTATAVYDYFSNHLNSIEMLWDKVPDPSEQIAPGISANIQSYQVSFIPTSEDLQFTINITIRDLTLCQDKCAVVISSTEMTSLYYSVFVTAENILGLGQRKSCNSQSIGIRNDLVAVDIKQCEGSIEVFCRLLCGFVGESHCEISYGRDLTGGHLPFFDTSEERGTRGDVLTIKLSHPLETNATYSFNLTIFYLNSAVKVFGTFTTGIFGFDAMGYCKVRDLGSLLGTEQDQCRWSEGVAIIKNGVVCYTGTATGSLAYYFCDEGYELNVLRGAIVNPRVNPRVCQQNGQWSIPGPECTKTPSNEGNNNVSILLTDESQPDVLKTCATSLAILGSVCFLISIFVGIIAGVILMCLCTSHKATQVSTPLYDYVGEPEKTDIATEQNKSYGCAPKLPKPRITSTSDRQRSSTNRSQ